MMLSPAPFFFCTCLYFGSFVRSIVSLIPAVICEIDGLVFACDHLVRATASLIPAIIL